jgi:hypothetical protein
VIAQGKTMNQSVAEMIETIINAPPEIIRELRFAPQYRDAAAAVLQKFGWVVEQKFPGERILVRLEQEGEVLRLIVQTPEGEIMDRIEETLSAYGQVITGALPPETLFTGCDPATLKLRVFELRSHLQAARFQIEQQKELQSLQRQLASDAIKSLETKYSDMKVLVHRMLSSATAKDITIAPSGKVRDVVISGRINKTNRRTYNELPTAIQAVIAEAIKRGDQLQLSPAESTRLGEAVSTVRNTLTQRKPTSSLLREGLSSIRHIFEHAAGAMIAHVPPEWLPALTRQIEDILKHLS